MSNDPEFTPRSEHFHYTVYGRNLCSNVALMNLLHSEFDDLDIRFRWAAGDSAKNSLGTPDRVKRFTTNVGSDLIVTEYSEGYSLRWEGRCDFTMGLDGSDIRCMSEPGIGLSWLITLLYSTVLSFSLQLQEIANLHAGCVSTENGAIGLMAAPGTGKSSLTAILAGAGHPFLTDDILTVTKSNDRYLAHPGYPTVSLTRSSAAMVLDPARMAKYEEGFLAEKARVEIDSEWATFSYDSVPLTALVLLDRTEGNSNFEPRLLTSIEAVQAIVENTVCIPFLPKKALQTYMKFAAELVSEVSVWHLPLPGNLNDMSAVIPDVVRDIVKRSSRKS